MTVQQVLGFLFALLGAIGLLGAAGSARRDPAQALLTGAVALIILAVGLHLIGIES